jgi:hypothetical protein
MNESEACETGGVLQPRAVPAPLGAVEPHEIVELTFLLQPHLGGYSRLKLQSSHFVNSQKKLSEYAEPIFPYESSDDACRVFRKMLETGHPPHDWSQ